MGFPRQYWSGLPFLPPGDLPDPRIEPRSPGLQVGPLPLSHLIITVGMGNSLAVQWLGSALSPPQGAQVQCLVKELSILHAAWCSQIKQLIKK